MVDDKIDNELEIKEEEDEIIDPGPNGDFRKYVRPFIACSITVLVVYLGALGKINADTIIAVFGTVAGFYFGAKD